MDSFSYVRMLPLFCNGGNCLMWRGQASALVRTVSTEYHRTKVQ
jgi:hypothetical protein